MDILHLFEDAKRFKLGRDEVLHTPDEKCLSLGYLVSGRLVMKKYLPGGRALHLTEFAPGDMYGELLVLSGESYRGWLIAEEPAEVLELGADPLNGLLEEPSFKREFFKAISDRLMKMTERIEILSHNRVSDRVVLYFLNNFKAGRSYDVNISSLAGELNCSREALSRSISMLDREGAVEKSGGTVCIKSMPLLERMLPRL